MNILVVVVLLLNLSDSCDPVDCSPPGSSVRGILQARMLEWVARPSSRDLSDPGIELSCPALQAGSLLIEPPGKPVTFTHLETELLVLFMIILRSSVYIRNSGSGLI